MRRAYVFIAMLSSGLMLLSCKTEDDRSAHAPSQQKSPLPVAVLSLGDVQPATAQRIADYVSDQYGCEVSRTVLKVEPDEVTLERLEAAVNEAIAAKASYAICLIDGLPGTKEDALRTRLSQNAGLVDLQTLKPEPDREVLSHEYYMRRIEKVSMGLLAELVGLEECPLPQCVLFSPAVRVSLDSKGRGFCPPCMQKAKRILAERGIKPEQKNGA